MRKTKKKERKRKVGTELKKEEGKDSKEKTCVEDTALTSGRQFGVFLPVSAFFLALFPQY